jgi:glycerol-3-phosphate dehydrogenase
MLYDVILIGGGVVGCAVARELARYDLSVALLEKTADVCNGQSKANTAIVHGGYDAAPGSNKAKFNVRGNAMFERITKELSVPFSRNGSLVVSFEEGGLPVLMELKRRGEANGVKGLAILGREALLAREPNLNPEACAALDVPTGGIVCPYELTVAYAENAAQNGVAFFRETPVTAVARSAAGCWRVETGRGEFTARAVVNCAGVHSAEFNNMVCEEKHSITARRGEYYIVDKNYRNAFRSTIFQLPTAMGKGVLIAPTVDGTILIGPTADDIPDKDDTRTTAAGLARVLERAKRSWPALPARAFITTYAGVRAHAETDDFILGEPADAPLFFNALGVESPGLSAAPALGEFLAQAVAERLGARPNPAFNPIRPGIPKFRDMTDAQREAAIARDPDYAKIVCRCELVTEAEIRAAIRRPVGARTVDGVKRRTRAGMGRCQAGFCLPRTLELLAEELAAPELSITKCGGESRYLKSDLFGGKAEG